MKALKKHIIEFIKSEDGPTAVEYAVMVALIIIVCITAISGLSSGVQKTFNTAAATLNGAAPGGGGGS